MPEVVGAGNMSDLSLTTLDPMQAQQDWRQTLAGTATAESKVGQQQAVTDLAQTRAKDARHQVDQGKQAEQSQADFQKTLSGIAEDLPVLEKLGKISNAALASGRFKEAEQTLGMMAKVEAQGELADQRRAKTEEAKAKTGTERLSHLMELVASVKDPESSRLMKELYKQSYGEDGLYKLLANMDYNPKIVEAAKEFLTKKMSGLDDALTRAKIATEQVKASRAAKTGDASVRYYDARIEKIQEGDKAKEKAGGKVATANPNDVKEVAAKIKIDHPDMPPLSLDLAARELASDAKSIQQKDGGSYAAAVQKAIDLKKDRFVTIPGEKTLMGFGSPGPSKTRFATGTMAAPIAATRNTQFESGKYYTTPKGVLRFNGTGFEASTPKGKAPDDGEEE